MVHSKFKTKIQNKVQDSSIWLIIHRQENLHLRARGAVLSLRACWRQAWQSPKTEIAEFIPSDVTEIASLRSQSDCVTIKFFTQKTE